MKLSISNIAWTADNDVEMYQYLKEKGYAGLEIAPTRIFPNSPYDRLSEAADYAAKLKEQYHLEISSMQSIWFGRQEKVFGDNADRKALIDYTRKACEFAKVIGCKNLVFGCPRNRETEDVAHDYPIAIRFFRTLGEIALENDTVIAMEANPVIYSTHFINSTEQAVKFVGTCNTEGLKVNVDLGTIIYNEECLKYIGTIGNYINHIHISEPGLKPIGTSRKELHRQLITIAKECCSDKYVSIEMGKCDVNTVKSAVGYIRQLADEQD